VAVQYCALKDLHPSVTHSDGVVAGSCRVGLVCFLAGWHETPLNHAVVSSYVSSFLVLLFGFFVLLVAVMCSFVSISQVIGCEGSL